MADCVRYVCGACRQAIEAWSDGNPYYFDEAGIKQYAYHPDHVNLARCIGNDCPHLCLACGAEFLVDSRSPDTACPKCGGSELAACYELRGKRCPYCKSGVFVAGAGPRLIS